MYGGPMSGQQACFKCHGTGKAYASGATYDTDASTTLYAIWTPGLVSASKVTLPTPTVRAGYIFNGWYTKASDGDRKGGAGSAYTFSSSTSLSIPSGKKTIPPLKKSKNAINLKSKTDQNIDLFDDNANPISMGKYRGARKDLVKLKMGGKSKVHELFINKPRNMEENEKIKQKFMEFIKEGKENKKMTDINGNKKSIARKKIEDAQNYNKSNK